MNNNETAKPIPLGCQITIQPVENGFIIQALNIDGTASDKRFIAANIPELRDRIRDISQGLYQAEAVTFSARSRSYVSPMKEE